MSDGIGMVVPTWGQRCGIAEYSKNLVCALRGRGHRVETLPFVREEMVSSLKEKDLNVIHFQYAYSLYDFGILREVTGFLRKEGGFLVATLHDFCGGLTEYNRFIIETFPKVVVHSEAVKEMLMRLGLPPGRVHVIPIGCPTYELRDRAKVREEMGIRGESPTIGFFGFALPQKGLIELGLAVKELRRTYTDLTCFIYAALCPYPSSKAYLARVRSCFEEMGLWEGVTLNSDYLPEEDLVQRLHAMDLNVLPYGERAFTGTSAAVRIVMAAKKPVITTDVLCFSDLSGEVYKITSQDPGEIAGAVLLLLKDEDRCKGLLSRMKNYVRENSWNSVAGRHLEVYFS